MILIKQLVHLLRLSHWSKSLFVFLGMIYAGAINYWFTAFLVAVSFSLISSAVYIYNDFYDRDTDRLHPRKCLRPLAAESISASNALWILGLLLTAGLLIGCLVSTTLLTLQVIYLLINLFYNHYLKKIPVLDVCCIASGFMLRVLAGTIGIDLFISWWLVLAATLVSLLIALCKRCLEKQLNLQHETRVVLKKYSITILNHLIAITAISCFIFYAVYIIILHKESVYFLITLPFVAFGLWRFVWLSRNEANNDDPIALCLSDVISCFNLLCFLLITFVASFR